MRAPFEPRRILVVGVNWVGDILFMTPAIRAIRRWFPTAYLACAVAPKGVDLLQGNPHIDELIPMEESRGCLGLFRWLGWVSQLRLKEFDTAFLFHRSFTRALVLRLAGIPHRIGYRTLKRGWLLSRSIEPPKKDSIHKAAFFLQLVEAAGISPDHLHYDAGFSCEDQKSAEQLLEKIGLPAGERFVALHPGANWRLKRWPLSEFARLGDQIAQRYHTKVVFIGEDGDLVLVEEIARRMQTRPFVATGKTTLRQLKALLARAQLLISNDSGPLHVGLAVGTPAVGLFGPTTPTLTGPPPGSKAISLFGSIGCPVPCYRLHCPVNLCMQQITLEQVLTATDQFLKCGDAPKRDSPSSEVCP